MCNKICNNFIFSGSGVDFGKVAKESWVHVLTCIEEPFKLPIGYFLIESLNASDRSKIILNSIKRAYEANAVVVALTLDGPNVNKDTLSRLGAQIDPFNSKPYFQHPCDPSLKIYCFYDPAHAVKLIRNHFASNDFYSENGTISFEYIQKLHNLQEKLKIKLGKLNYIKIDNYKNKKLNFLCRKQAYEIAR